MEGGHFRAHSQNLCAIRLLKWFETRIDSIPTVSHDYSYDGIDLTGSMAYSFDIGSWHFVQLNNHPGYERGISSYDSWKVCHRDFDIRKSINWLKNDLEQARDKKVVLNLHVMGYGDFSDSSDEGYSELGEIIDNNSNVVAIFTGHIHSRISQYFTDSSRQLTYSPQYFTTPNNRSVPVFFSGAAETNWYLKAEFEDSSLKVTPVDSSNGDVSLQTAQSQTISITDNGCSGKGKIALLSHHGKYVVAESYGDANANRSRLGSYEMFDLISHSDGTVSFKSVHNTYIVAESNGAANANRTVLDRWEKFTPVSHGKSIFSFKSVHGKYLVAEKNGNLNANRDEIGSREKFELKILFPTYDAASGVCL